jgi:putative hemolysin
LVPKSLALRYSESFALISAYPILWVGKLTSWLVKILTFSSNLILKPLGDSTSFSESKLSEEEIRTLIKEGGESGAIEATEHQLIQNVFEFSDMTVDKIMTPRNKITALDINEAKDKLIKQAIDSGYSRIPIYKKRLSDVVGILHAKDLLSHEIKEGGPELQQILRSPFFAPSSQKISNLLRQFQKNKRHLALVTDEHGNVEGLITMEDILEEIVGEISDETDEIKHEITDNKNGTFTVMGDMSVVDFNKFFMSKVPENQDYNTISGFVIDRLGRFPRVDDRITFQNLNFTVKEITSRTTRILEVKIK